MGRGTWRLKGRASAPPPDPEPGDMSFTIPTNGTADPNLTALTKDVPSGNTVTVTHAASSPVVLRYFG